MLLDRARTIRALVEAHTDRDYRLYINGPMQAFQRPEHDIDVNGFRVIRRRKMVGVQYVVCCNPMPDEQKQEIVDIVSQWDDVAEAQITKRVQHYYRGVPSRVVGGNIRITFKTRAHSRTFSPGEILLVNC